MINFDLKHGCLAKLNSAQTLALSDLALKFVNGY